MKHLPTGLFLALLLASCATGTVTPVPTSTPAVAQSPSPTPTATPTATPTPAPTPVNTDVQTTTSAGLGYSILTPAPAGAAVCKFGDTVSVEYTGWLTDGKQFDSSVGKPPFKFKIGSGQAIQGWNLGIKGMAVGEVRKLVLPPDLAYGSSGQGPIPPDATLIFQVKLISIDQPAS